MLIPMRTGYLWVSSDRKQYFMASFLPAIKVTAFQKKLATSTNGRQFADRGMWREPL